MFGINVESVLQSFNVEKGIDSTIMSEFKIEGVKIHNEELAEMGRELHVESELEIAMESTRELQAELEFDLVCESGVFAKVIKGIVGNRPEFEEAISVEGAGFDYLGAFATLTLSNDEATIVTESLLGKVQNKATELAYKAKAGLNNVGEQLAKVYEYIFNLVMSRQLTISKRYKADIKKFKSINMLVPKDTDKDIDVQTGGYGDIISAMATLSTIAEDKVGAVTTSVKGNNNFSQLNISLKTTIGKLQMGILKTSISLDADITSEKIQTYIKDDLGTDIKDSLDTFAEKFEIESKSFSDAKAIVSKGIKDLEGIESKSGDVVNKIKKITKEIKDKIKEATKDKETGDKEVETIARLDQACKLAYLIGSRFVASKAIPMFTNKLDRLFVDATKLVAAATVDSAKLMK